MMRQARARGWCSEYEDFVREVNEAAGFPALSARVRRREATVTVKVRVRGSLHDCEDALEKFNEHLSAFESETALAWRIDVRNEWTGDREEADNESIMEADELRPDAGLAVNGCDCPSCRQERAMMAAQAQGLIPDAPARAARPRPWSGV